MKRRTVLLLALTGVIASQIGWPVLRKRLSAADRFNLRIIETTVGDADHFAAIVVKVELTNLGRPAAADDFALEIRQGTERIPTETVRVDPFTTFDLKSKVGKSQILRGSEWLPGKTASSALERGESRTGFLLFWSRHAAAIDMIRRADTRFAISFTDSRGYRHEAVYDVGQLNFQPRPLLARAPQRRQCLSGTGDIAELLADAPIGAMC